MYRMRVGAALASPSEKEKQLYKVTWNYDGKEYKAKVKSPVGRYTYCQMLENEGATDITIKWKGEVIDNYLQGRSMRNFPSFQNYWKQLDLF